MDFPHLASPFNAYAEGVWAEWAATEGPRRKTIQLQALEAEGAENPLELVWGLGVAVWKHPSGHVLRYPIITQLVEIALDAKTLALEIRPRDRLPVLEMDAYAELDVPGVVHVEATWRGFIERVDSTLSPFEAGEVESVLKASVGFLDASGIYWPDVRTDSDRTVPSAQDHLIVTDTWVIFARKSDLNEVEALGSVASVLRTADETDLARFYTDPPPLYTPRNWRRFATDSQSIADNARLLALLWVSTADSSLGCFESKYHYRFWRPRTAIPRADEDGNPETTADPGWAPIVPTPNHPEYPAAHTCSEGALAEALRQFYGTKKIHFILDSGVAGLLHPVHEFTSTDQMVMEVADARVFGGMHFRNSTREGARLGRRTTEWISERFFRRVDEDSDH